MLSSGFYNSKGGDRKYDAEQFGAMFNGLITDGVFAHYKDALKVTAGSGNRELVVKPGRAWFNGTWTEVDDDGHSIYLMGSAVETTYFVYLAINKLDRKNTIAWYSNIANNDPEKGLYFYLLAQVTVPGGATKISESMITDTRGSDLCPYVTGIMETVSFEEIVKRVCGDSWQDWLGVYEAGITTGVQNAVATSERALDEVKSLKAYAVESEATSYIWAKFEAVATGGGGFEWATDSVHTELSDPPMPVCLFRNLSYADLGPGFKPSISLSTPYIADGETTVKAIPAVTQSKVWKEYPYFWEGGASFGTEVLRYDDLQRVVVNVGGTATEKYTYRVSRLMHIPVAYEPGEYIGTVSADNATAYPRDGYKDGYYYMRFAANAEDVSFYYPGLSANNVQDAIIEVALTGGTGGGSAMSVIEVDELPETGISGVMYVVKKSGDSDAVEYLWLDRWEKIGGTGSAGNGTQGGGGVAVTPQMFGAAGDGETDDTAAIQAMFDSVGDGGLIYFPAGTYVVRHSDIKTGEDYVAVTVHGRHGLRIVLDNGATLLHKATTVHRYTMLRFDGCDGVEISGGVIEGDRQSHPAVTTSYGSKGIHIVDSVNISVHDMEVREIFGDCIGITGATVQCDNVLIEKCTLHDSYRNGITIGGARNSTVRNCHIYGIVGGDPQAGIDLEAERGIANADITIDGSYIHDCARNAIAFSSNGTGTRVRNCRLDGNTIFDNTHTGVEITGTAINGTANFHNDVVLRGCSVTAVGCYDTTDHHGVSLTAYNTIFGGKDDTPTININGINGVATLRLVGCALNHPESSGYALVYSYNNDNGNVDVMMEGCTVNLRNGTALHRQLAHGKYRAFSLSGCTIAVRSATMDYSFIRTDADQVRISNCTIDLSGVESYRPAEIAYFWKRNSVIEFNGNVILASVPISNVLCLESFTGTAHITNNTAPMCGAMVKVAGSGGTVVQKGNITANSAEGSGSGASVTIDTTLTQSGQAADAKAVGDALEGKQPKGEYLTEQKLKTINGQSIVGEGNIEITGGETTEQPEYVRVKYLENTGTQYIDTGYVIQEDDVIEVDYEIPESALSVGTDKILLDARDASNGIRVSTWGSNYKWYARFGHSSGSTSAAYSKQYQTGTFSISKNTLVLNGTTVLSDMPFTAMPTGTLKLFAGVAHDTGAISGPSYSRIIQVKVKRNGETIHCYVSKQRTSDSELGMHDTVTGEFFTNAGTGIFGYAPADVVESTTVQRKPTLTDEQKAAMQALMDDYYNNRGTFYYEFTHNRNAFTSGGSCYTSAKGKFKQCCATFVQNIMMGRSVSDFVGKNASTYSAAITRTPVSDFGYYFDFKYRKYLYGLTDTDENGDTVYYGYNQPNADNYEGSYSYNSYYHPDSTKANKQNFNGFCNANDMARELYEMGCEIPFSELDVGDIIFTLDNDLSDNSSMLNFHAWRNIYHVGMVYDVKQIDASSKEIYYIECTSYFDVDNRPIEKPFLSSSQMDLRFKAFKLTEDMAFCARMPVAFGYESNVPDRITTSAVP